MLASLMFDEVVTKGCFGLFDVVTTDFQPGFAQGKGSGRSSVGGSAVAAGSIATSAVVQAVQVTLPSGTTLRPIPAGSFCTFC